MHDQSCDFAHMTQYHIHTYLEACAKKISNVCRLIARESEATLHALQVSYVCNHVFLCRISAVNMQPVDTSWDSKLVNNQLMLV